MADQFNPFATGALYDQHAGRWQLEQDVAEPVLDVLAAGRHLPRFSDKEHANDYAYRKSMSAFLDMCPDAVGIRIDNIFRVPPQREVKAGKYQATIRQLIHDADGGGTSLDAFMRRALWKRLVTGCDIAAQVTAAPDGTEITTEADVRAAGLRPYFMQFSPLSRYDWATDGEGNFLWVRYCLGAEPRGDETGGREDAVTEFLALTRTEWRRHRAWTDADSAGRETVHVETTTGSHSFGKVPVVKFYCSESNKPGQAGVPLSLLTRPAVVAKLALNIKSQADADLIAAVPRWMFSGDGELPDTFGPGTLWHTRSPDGKLQVVQGDVGHIVEKRAWFTLYLLEILRLLKFRGGMADLEGSHGSGVKLALEMTDLQNELRSTAGEMEAAELEMMRTAVCLYTGERIAPHEADEALGYEVHYTRDFVLEPVADMLSSIQVLLRGCGEVAGQVPELVKEMVRQLGTQLVRPGSPTGRRIAEEIDAADFRAPRAARADTASRPAGKQRRS